MNSLIVQQGIHQREVDRCFRFFLLFIQFFLQILNPCEHLTVVFHLPAVIMIESTDDDAHDNKRTNQYGEIPIKTVLHQTVVVFFLQGSDGFCLVVYTDALIQSVQMLTQIKCPPFLTVPVILYQFLICFDSYLYMIGVQRLEPIIGGLFHLSFRLHDVTHSLGTIVVREDLQRLQQILLGFNSILLLQSITAEADEEV